VTRRRTVSPTRPGNFHSSTGYDHLVLSGRGKGGTGCTLDRRGVGFNIHFVIHNIWQYTGEQTSISCSQ